MNCAQCHDGSIANSVVYPMGSPQMQPADVFTHMIRSGHMPPQNDLTPQERDILLCSLKSEYFEGFTDRTLGGGLPNFLGQSHGTLLDYLTDDQLISTRCNVPAIGGETETR